MLAVWLEAEKRVAISGQSYQISTDTGMTRRMTRADLPMIREQVSYWKVEIKRLQAGGITTTRFVP